MGKTKPLAILGLVACTIFTALGQFTWKFAVNNFQLDNIWANWPIILGFAFYGIGMAIMLISFKHGELSVLFPLIALGFIWVSILSTSFLGETMSLTNWAGVIAIVAGVSFIGVGGNK